MERQVNESVRSEKLRGLRGTEAPISGVNKRCLSSLQRLGFRNLYSLFISWGKWGSPKWIIYNYKRRQVKEEDVPGTLTQM